MPSWASGPLPGGSVRHSDWDELEVPVRLAIEARRAGCTLPAPLARALNSQLAVVLDTDAGVVFIKGLRAVRRAP